MYNYLCWVSLTDICHLIFICQGKRKSWIPYETLKHVSLSIFLCISRISISYHNNIAVNTLLNNKSTTCQYQWSGVITVYLGLIDFVLLYLRLSLFICMCVSIDIHKQTFSSALPFIWQEYKTQTDRLGLCFTPGKRVEKERPVAFCFCMSFFRTLKCWQQHTTS